jgi:type IV secretion system protein VirB9
MKNTNYIIKFFAIALCFIAVFAGSANATEDSRPLPVDHRVRTIVYKPDEVYKFIGHYRYQTSIEFAKDEEIKTISMGDSTAWMLNPSGSRLFLKPIEQDATTNMTLITNKHTYLFELHARETAKVNDPDMIFVMRFIYPDSGNMQSFSDHLDAVPEPDFLENPAKYNSAYTISGSDEIAPIRIFDDGEFTFFQFRDKNTEVPAFFWVDEDNNEALINYRTRGDYIVIERVASRFTLRHGSYIVCVFNEQRLRDKKSKNVSLGIDEPPPPPPQQQQQQPQQQPLTPQAQPSQSQATPQSSTPPETNQSFKY